MFSMCSELTPRAPVPDNRTPQLMQPCWAIFFRVVEFCFLDRIQRGKTFSKYVPILLGVPARFVETRGQTSFLQYVFDCPHLK